MSRALIGALLLMLPLAYAAGRSEAGILVVVSPCEPVAKPVPKWKKTVRV